jgi:hypothetical protein
MKYNPNDIVLLEFRTARGTETKVAIIQEKHYVGIVYRQSVYKYLVLMCGIPQPTWARGEEIIKVIFSQ